MTDKTLYISAFAFAFIIIASNYLVGFRIFDAQVDLSQASNTLTYLAMDIYSHITYGAISYPISFLLMDILSEKFNRKDVLKALRIGLLLAFLPSIIIAPNPYIAVASVCAFFTSQFLDVIVFFKLKQKYPRLWWLRNGVNSGICQFVDTFIFFHVAFVLVLPYHDVFMMFLADLIIKLSLNLFNMPIFYLVAIKTYNKLNFFKR
ncbi:queuosine precursor transporter [Helicobacter saguini]|uniref:Probable queuosine precursor transporter n=2 Tax=Helicobacter saguini TaxID=1548018 RepID=A0A347VTR2_9HELI|nr:queuosine precursor transporter [Helicobacter saguini]MWV67405.1 queuosine precursor transporter [Helicobacter saguini]MWV69758.1 queuosine precursor transporter [Helicobacter saguini]MWV73025.1 queuosine precursor transporter [Helicobacter saguini]TLD95698.1 VUT family protein [Helicobacter saguini]